MTAPRIQRRYSGTYVGQPSRTFELQALRDSQAWKAQGLCNQTDPDSFFPEAADVPKAKQVCMACEVRWTCLEYALENDERFGVWGGLSASERRKLLRNKENNGAGT